MAKHQPVLLQESIEGLAIKAEGIYVDCTFGRGGHSRAILDRLNEAGRLIAIDKDAEAIQHAQQQFAQDSRFQIFQGSFANLKDIALACGVYGNIDGILLDLGVSSPQLDDPLRGFSFMQAGPLDMRMDQQQALSAAEFVNQAKASEMAEIFREYGEERFAGRIARAIVQSREEAPILTTEALAEIVKQANPKWEKHKHPATRVFQAIRIYINQELTDLKKCLQQCIGALAIGGKLVVISFHSLEDRIVKQFMKAEEQGATPPPGIPLKAVDMKTCFKRIGKAIKPHHDEIKQNVRARSAVLRIGEKIA
ncbi:MULTISPECIES: 16S rRNA (cytosine(1402)-N(4))-methyltransferase RsmH [Legionella]|uniref:Ribosomal RNA small subunit methyltransferase H n=1 Tax=Legionella septentrionalis TaxID=2498109 RepID=A0A433JKQ7_9GAMM|nr:MULTISPECIES: 16S rRNA (cytosine(1402)-N(4))-methyltransferase RsmH [Legionella]MCP0914316.1 16S rRNA (cytosine(1402)-N(4))-methyltransferase RsmH [Legionella sp. 27cVA30]RUQ89023.1 16S rRNA (cytosine(1402)-N(4))-methyltransferase RsmH [Legionella septentrionalis]RUR00330.1 16S rRNA (cytosine(1402)-N(4))-methyltransferase RsmH [Legionella septentrionalis]RUR11813.1 16S rRNA (cytosine(1402)-N(4))-methyltransferase RsmH [Legionella septentrionalis]RUR17501.1 16S rRNA (cytosine(1402)-N(4))-met